METWDCKKRTRIKTPKEMKNFFDEIESVCKKYNLCISHEDSHGSFTIVKYDDLYIDWLKNANKDY